MKISDNKNIPPYILTADIGGSHITSAICNTDTYIIEENSVVRLEVDSKAGADEIIGSWQSALKMTLSAADVEISGIGVAMPGPFDYAKGISYIKGLNKYEAIYGMNIKEAIAGFLNIPGNLVHFRNDAEATIAGEALTGAGAGYKKVAGVTLGTGFGSAYCTEGIARDLNYGSDLYKESIADDYLSTRWFQKRYYELTGKPVANVKALAALLPYDSNAKQVFDEFAANMADFLKKPLQQLSPDVLVLCGNITRASAYFLPQLREHLPAITIQTALLGEKAALIGASVFTNINVLES
ncbi:ROK family protein [Mucilaginibacter rigui]|uniref:ROK family protein n=1 Tax=Mucilaginibacter rigui TaxID=534635 RepID=A0ABR7X871_9SPHI|nr:ROK family protein [Mucilaginibacter rigui]MBD1386788.1 ROK family protein [Mucilaginibacter rigui]